MAGDDHVHVAVFELGEGGVDDVLAVDPPDADARDRALERQGADGQGRGGGDETDDVGVGVGVGREDHHLNLHLVPEALGPQGADGPVDHPHREDFLGAGPAFALEKAAGELSGGGHLLAVVDEQGEEVDVLPFGGGDHRAEHDGVAVADEGRAGGLPGEPADLDAHESAADLSFHRKRHDCPLPSAVTRNPSQHVVLHSSLLRDVPNAGPRGEARWKPGAEPGSGRRAAPRGAQPDGAADTRRERSAAGVTSAVRASGWWPGSAHGLGGPGTSAAPSADPRA